MGRACVGVGQGMLGAAHGVQLPQDGDGGAGGAALQLALDAGDGQLRAVGNPQLFKLGLDLFRRLEFLKAEFRLPGHAGGVLLQAGRSFVDGGEGGPFQLFVVSHKNFSVKHYKIYKDNSYDTPFSVIFQIVYKIQGRL